ncbi:LCP family glycopolymer transferase [Paenibacillus sp. Soil522]|uniref:LCP family glycopolymer transferase n=1 Tax=Paenibacillus sp. Soil522 TaxID=1736388 RepID=UPI0006FF6A83|nr:LCP family protein [Paenibacillus sp. Soil522]KRE47886.1 hypothetical protein ASG81_08210 [Paenibacillus sp. Soil522]
MNRRLKLTLIWTGAVVATILLLVGGLVWYVYNSAQQTAAKIYDDLEPVNPAYISKDTDVNKATEPMKNLDPFTVLVLGVDERKNDRGRSDTMIVLTVNPVKQSILIFNIPRDTRTEIIGHGTIDKINHAYAFGGVEMSIQTVENFLDYPIDYYAKVNMEGFARLIDLIGGVEVDNPFSFDYEGHKFDQGHLSLNGTLALKYSRMRYDDPRGDFGRNTRQRDILQEVMNRAMSFSNVTQLQSILGELKDSVKTNITFDEMKQFVTDYRPQIHKIDMVEVQGKGQIINRIWYYNVENDERTRIHNKIKEHLQKVS